MNEDQKGQDPRLLQALWWLDSPMRDRQAHPSTAAADESIVQVKYKSQAIFWEHFGKVTEVLSRVRPSVCPSVAKRSAQTAHWILIKFGVNMQKGMGMPPLLFIFF